MFNSSSDFGIIAAHLIQAPIPPIDIDPTLPLALSKIIMKLLEKDRAARFQSANAVRNELMLVLPQFHFAPAGWGGPPRFCGFASDGADPCSGQCESAADCGETTVTKKK